MPDAAGDPAAAYAGKPPAYFSGARGDFVAELPCDPTAKVLEIGCGDGATGRLAKASGRAGRYVGIELFPSAAAEARQILDEVIIGNVETLDLPFAPCTFDAVILSEVLEHLVEPGRLLARIAPLVRPGGLALASSPNVAHWRVIRELIGGRFDLADQGVFDRTHMRWFTPTTFARMFGEAGFAVEKVRPVTPFSQQTRMISRLTGGRLDHLFMAQISIRARRT